MLMGKASREFVLAHLEKDQGAKKYVELVNALVFHQTTKEGRQIERHC